MEYLFNKERNPDQIKSESPNRDLTFDIKCNDRLMSPDVNFVSKPLTSVQTRCQIISPTNREDIQNRTISRFDNPNEASMNKGKQTIDKTSKNKNSIIEELE